MSKGCWIHLYNLTPWILNFFSPVTLANKREWGARKPLALSEGVNPAIAPSGVSRFVYVDINGGRRSAKFTVELEADRIGTVSVVVDAHPMIEGGQRKGPLALTGGTAADKFLILESQHDKQEWERQDGRTLSIIVTPKIDPKRWMSLLSDDYKLNDLTIPGTHDSGTKPISGIRQCQSLSIAEQLDFGIRFLDIRLDKSKNWEITHEDTSTGLFFENDCLQPIKNFLDANPSETVLLCVKDEKGSTDAFHDGVMSRLQSRLGSRLFAGHKPGKLGKATDADTLRGKVVLLRRYWIDPATNTKKVGDADSGIGLTEFKDANGNTHKFPDKSDSFKDLGADDKVLYQQPGGLPFAIQDWYDLQTRYQPAKIRLLAKYLHIANNSPADTWFLNFASTTASGHAWDGPKNFAIGDDNINAALFTYFATHGKGRYGIIPIDFAGENPKYLVHLMISCNRLNI